MEATFTLSCSTTVVRIEHGFEEEMEQSNREEHEWGLGGATERRETKQPPPGEL